MTAREVYEREIAVNPNFKEAKPGEGIIIVGATVVTAGSQRVSLAARPSVAVP